VITINLIDAHAAGLIEPKRARSLTSAWPALTFVTIAALAGYGVLLHMHRARLSARWTAIEPQVARLTEGSASLDAARTRQENLSGELAALHSVLHLHRTTPSILAAISRGTVDGVSLREIRHAAGRLTLEGQASSVAAVARFTTALGGEAVFARSPEIRSVTADDEVVRFQIVASVSESSAQSHE
jgi:Tfp pilus assembly protein PilN